MITLEINGKTHQLEHSVSIAELLDSLGFAGKPVVIELNKQALLPQEYRNTLVNNGSKVEIITIAAGG